MLQMLIALRNNDRRFESAWVWPHGKKIKARKVIALHQNMFVLVQLPFICQHLQPNNDTLLYSKQVIIVNPCLLRSRLDRIT